MYYVTNDENGLITGRYLKDIHGDGFPVGAVEVSKEIFEASIQMQRPALVNGELIEIPPTPTQLLEQAKGEAFAYLNSTDWYVTRMTETGVAIPEDVLAKRAECRELL
jgi:hypothetical protein